MKRVLAAIVIATVATHAQANVKRSAAEVAAFKRENPCPSTGKRRGACPGYVVDHVEPLCNGGRDHPSNMQWQTVAEAKEKDKEERRMCIKNRPQRRQ
jgi:hypothetical protein